MTAFAYHNGELHAEGVALSAIAEAAGTPVYVYASAALEDAYDAFATAFADQPAQICYALKANSNLAVIRTLARRGAGADVVSGGELRRAQVAGVPGDRIVFSGVGKSAEEIQQAIAANILQFNVESVPELELLSEIAARTGRAVDIAIRVNPDVDAGTHAKITTGTKQNKFGIDLDDARGAFDLAARLPGLNPRGVAVHIGSQLTSLDPFRDAFARVADFTAALRDAGHTISHLDLGGGLGVDYQGEVLPGLTDYAAMVRQTVGHLGCHLTFEPGRRIAGAAGVLLARVLFVKDTADRRFIVLDAAMNDLTRPAMYDAWHAVRPVTDPGTAALTPADIVGPVCESGDTFAVQRPMPPVAAGDLLVFDHAGAYGAVMASTYNSRPLVAEAMVRGDRHAIIRPRPTVEEMLAQDVLPVWLDAADRRGHAGDGAA